MSDSTRFVAPQASGVVNAEVISYDPYALPTGAIREPPGSLWLALRQIGPGIILAGSIIGTGELLLTTSLGADYGFLFLWLILFSCLIKVFVQIELGRYAISSGKPTLGALNEMPGPRLRVNWLVWWWLILILATVAQLGAMAGGVGQALNLAFPKVAPATANLFRSIWPQLSDTIRERPDYPWAIITSLAAVLLLLSGGYHRIERVTAFMMAAVTAFTIVCVVALPATGYELRLSEIEAGLKPNPFGLPTAAIAAAFATFGITGVGATELYAYPYWCLEKGYARFTGPYEDSEHWVRRARGWIRVMYLDAWVSMLVYTVATVCFYFMGATVLHRQDLHPKGVGMIETLSQMYVPMFGSWTKFVFLLGVFVVLFKCLYVNAAAHSRLMADFLNLAGFVHYPNADARAVWIRRFCIFFPLGAVIFYLAIGEPRAMVVFGGFFQGITLPLIAGVSIYLRFRRTEPRIAPTAIFDWALWISFLSIVLFAGYTGWAQIMRQILPAVLEFFGVAVKS
jgi:manganese transport protein